MSERFWPPDLPQSPRVSSFAKSSGNNTVRSNTETGPAKVRKRSSSAMSQLQCAYRLNRKYRACGAGKIVDQLDLLFVFLEEGEGMSFWIPDPMKPTEEIKVRIRPEGDDKGVTVQAVSNNIFDVLLNLEVWPLARRPRT